MLQAKRPNKPADHNAIVLLSSPAELGRQASLWKLTAFNGNCFKALLPKHDNDSGAKDLCT